MPFLCRLILACLFALFAVRGATACEHMQRIAQKPNAVVVASDHCGTTKPAEMTNASGNGSHGACGTSCCVAGCGVHCGAPPVVSALGMPAPGGSTLAVLPVPMRAGITHAPPLPPPIV